MPMTDEQIADALALAQKAKRSAGEATPGPWASCRNQHPECSGAPWGWVEKSGLNISLAYWSGNRSAQAEANARFVARARTDVPALAAAVESLAADLAAKDAEIARLKEAVAGLRHYAPSFEQAELLERLLAEDDAKTPPVYNMTLPGDTNAED